jgi:hypothetical protein
MEFRYCCLRSSSNTFMETFSSCGKKGAVLRGGEIWLPVVMRIFSDKIISNSGQ